MDSSVSWHYGEDCNNNNDVRDGEDCNNNNVRGVAYWKREAEEARRNLKILEYVTKMDGKSEEIFHTVREWWNEREQRLREEYEKKLLDMEMAYTRDVEMAMVERKRLDSALNCIRHVTTSLSPLEEMDDGSTIVHHVVADEEDCGVENVSDGSVVYTREEEEEEEERECKVGNRCSVVGYRGEIPDVLTENSLNRILDKPLCGDEKRVFESPSWKIPSIHTRTAMIPQEHVVALEKRLKRRQEWSTRVVRDDDEKDVAGGVRDDVVGEDDAFVRTIKALGDSSPKTANVLTQHVTDSWAVKKYGKHGNVSRQEDTFVQRKKSTFLQRPPIPLQGMFESSSTPFWMNATVL
ncbi:hypothetical protein M9435_005473 [Picochlorum sp. BPE23]|nr:hypothetical protein M9435_005473 [Picochlorum sp. BPE23]